MVAYLGREKLKNITKWIQEYGAETNTQESVGKIR